MTGATDDRASPAEPGDQDGAALLERFQAGDREAFAAFVDLHADHCYRLAARLLGQRSDAEDATQSAFLQAFLRAGTFRPGARARAWLGGIVVNCCHGLRRREHALQLRHRRAWLAGSAIPPAEPAELVEDGSTERELVDRELARLGEDERLALWMRYGQGLRFREIAERLGVPQKTVESRVQRALAALRARLAARDRQDAAPLASLGALVSDGFGLGPRLVARAAPGLRARLHAAVADVAAPPCGTGLSASAAGAGSASLSPPATMPGPAGPGRWWISARAASTAVAALAATVAVIVARGPAPLAVDAAASSGAGPAVIDHPAGTDLLGAMPAATPAAVPADRTHQIRYTLTVLPLDAPLARLVSWPPGKDAVVAPAATVRALVDANAQRHGMRTQLTCWPGYTGTSRFIHQYAYIGDYDELPIGPDPNIAVLNYGGTFTVGGTLAGAAVLITTLGHREVQPLRILGSQFMHRRGRYDTVCAYPLEEWELALRQATLAEPLAIDADQGLVVRIAREERHRIRATKARALGVPLTPIQPDDASSGWFNDATSMLSTTPADDGEQVLVVTAEVVRVEPAGDDDAVAPSGVARR